MQEAQTAIESYDAAARKARPSVKPATSQGDELVARFMAAETDGSLAQRVRDVVAVNRSKAAV